MSSVGERWSALWHQIRHSPAQVPMRVVIPRERVDRGATLGEPFQAEKHYFQVRVNRLFLAAGREWFSHYDPMVFVVSEFTYDAQVEAVPFVVGPTLMEKHGQQIPNGMVFTNTRVAGLHPYRGGRLALSVILCRVARTNYARALLNVVENAAGALDFSTVLSSYVKVADVVLTGVEALLGLGDTDPLVGVRTEFDPDAGDVVEPSYFALINAPSLDTSRLWVREHELVYGASLATATPFVEADYVLYSLVHTTERQDERILPFYALWDQVQRAATQPDGDSWRAAKANMLALYQALVLSPDLTPGHAHTLTDRYTAEMQQYHDRAVNLGALGGALVPDDRPALPPVAPKVEAQLKAAVNILDL